MPDAERPPLRATLDACGTGPTPDERFAVFGGSMPARKGTRRMAMRFDLYERRSRSGRFKRVSAAAFGRWDRSLPDRAGFVYTKQVERLRDGADYRAVVRFRWYDARGETQRTTRRTTPVCEQPDRRADLVVEAVEARPGDAEGAARYLITVANTGLTAAGPFDVGLVAGREEATGSVGGLEAGARTTVEVAGRACEAGAPIAATADVRGAVDEADEDDNEFRTPCGGR